MVATRTVLMSVLIVVGTAACGSDEEQSTSTSTSLVAATTTIVTTTTTTAAASTTTSAAAATTTVAPTTTFVEPTTTVEVTTTTVAPGAALKLSPTGLGAADFGTDPEAVITYVSSLIGPASSDSGWTDPIVGGFGVCPGNEVRGVAWNDLLLLFSDNTDVASGRRHFFAYILGPTFEADINPFGLTTDAGIGIGSTVASLRGTYPAAFINPADDISPASFLIFSGLTGQLTSDADDGQVSLVRGGTGCGE